MVLEIHCCDLFGLERGAYYSCWCWRAGVARHALPPTSPRYALNLGCLKPQVFVLPNWPGPQNLTKIWSVQ